MRILVSVGLIVLGSLASGCASSGPLYSDARKMYAEIAPNKTRLIFFRPSNLAAIVTVARVRIDGKLVGYLYDNTGLVIDREPTSIEITMDSRLYTGKPLSIPLMLQAGSEYYFEVGTAFTLAKTGTIGLLPYLLDQTTPMLKQYCGADWCAEQVDKDTALPKLEKVRLETPLS